MTDEAQPLDAAIPAPAEPVVESTPATAPSVDEQIGLEAEHPVQHALSWLEAEAVELFGDVKAVIAWIASKL